VRDRLARLAAALGFTEHELDLNRAGRVSDRQRVGLERSRSWTRGGNVVMSVVLLAFVGVAVAVVVPRMGGSGPSNGSLVPMAVGAVALVVVIGVGSGVRSLRAAARRASGRVNRVEGPAATRVVILHANVADVSSGGFAYGGGVRYEVTVGARTFIVATQAVLDAFEPAQHYVAYYAGDDRFASLLSAEPSDGS
jgi:hypothetical protein